MFASICLSFRRLCRLVGDLDVIAVSIAFVLLTGGPGPSLSTFLLDFNHKIIHIEAVSISNIFC